MYLVTPAFYRCWYRRTNLWPTIGEITYFSHWSWTRCVFCFHMFMTYTYITSGGRTNKQSVEKKTWFISSFFTSCLCFRFCCVAISLFRCVLSFFFVDSVRYLPIFSSRRVLYALENSDERLRWRQQEKEKKKKESRESLTLLCYFLVLNTLHV